MCDFKLFTACLVFSVFSANHYCEAEDINIECIPLADCPVAMKLVTTKKFAPGTIQFLKYSHCGYSENKAPLVWCPNLNYCKTPDGRNGTCTDIVNCQSLLNTAATTNILKEYRCNTYLRNSVQICCPEDTPKMQTRITMDSKSDDSEEKEEPYVFDRSADTTRGAIALNNPSSVAILQKEEEDYLGDQAYPSRERKYFPNSIEKQFPKHHHVHFHDQDRVHHNFDTDYTVTQGSNSFYRKDKLGRHNHEGSDSLIRDTSNTIGGENNLGNHLSYDDNISSEADIHFEDNSRQTSTKKTQNNKKTVEATTTQTSTSKTIYRTTQTTSYHKTTQSPTRSWGYWRQHENNTKSNDTVRTLRTNIFENVSSICGRQTANDDKIVGGSIVDLGEFPWMALLQYTRDQEKKFGCGGTLISNRHVLTAAHCVDSTVLKAKRLELYRVILGEYDTRNETDCIYLPFGTNCADPPQTYGIKSVVKHKKFNSINGTDDIALIYLDREVKFTDYIRPICLPTETTTIKTNASVIVAGWGRTTTSENFSPILKKAKLPNVEKGDCNQYGRSLTKGQICTGFGNGVDTCTGDSGGPLMTAQAQNFEFVTYQIGVVSYGFVAEGCGSAPSVNTFVPYYKDWINQNVG